MLAYKDRVWCTEAHCAHSENCPNFFSDEEAAKAVKWWGDNDFPICAFTDRPKCFEGETK